MFAKNGTLLCLNLRRTGIGLEAGQTVERGLRRSGGDGVEAGGGGGVCYLALGGNGVGVAQQRDMTETLERNRRA